MNITKTSLILLLVISSNSFSNVLPTSSKHQINDQIEGQDIRLQDTYVIKPAKEYSRIKQLSLNVSEKIWSPADGENTPWVHSPTKVISFPITKIQYEATQFVTSLLTESVMRSPVHNALGTLDEAKKTLMLIKNGLFDILRGILNPQNAAFVDGILGTSAGVLNSVNIIAGATKTAVSTVAYPTYRLLGGSASERDGVKGKRAVIVFIDTGVAQIVDTVIDPYGDQIVRHHLNGIANYYCVVSNVEGDRKSCIDNIPYDTEFVDLVALTHGGGTSRMDRMVDDIVSLGHKPGLMLSIGCQDTPSKNTKSTDALGQQGTTWAVHYYISSAIAKRIRGLPIQDASEQAFYENLPINFINPVSLLGQLGVGMMGDSIFGSLPATRDYDSNDQVEHLELLIKEANINRIVRYAKLYQEGQISKSEFGKLVHVYSESKESILEYLENNERKELNEIASTYFPKRTRVKVKRLGGRSVFYKYRYL